MPALSYEYTFSTATTEPPGNSQIRSNSTDVLSTLVWVKNDAASGEDVHEILMQLVVGDDLYIQDFDDHTKNVHYQLTGLPVDKVDYVEFPVTHIASGSALTGQRVSLLMLTKAVIPAEYLTEAEGDARYVMQVQGTAVPPPVGTARPTVEQVALLLRARTKDSNGTEVGTFDDDTRPTGDQVEEQIDAAMALVGIRFGPVGDMPAEAQTAFASLVAYRAALRIEKSYFPEQVRSDRSAYTQLREEYLDDLQAFTDAMTGGGGEGALTSYDFAQVPVGSWTSLPGSFIFADPELAWPPPTTP